MSASDPGDMDAADTALSVAERIEFDERSSAGFIPGGYTCRCYDCDNMFRGNARALRCIPCADQLRTMRQHDMENRWNVSEGMMRQQEPASVVVNVPNPPSDLTNRAVAEFVRRAREVQRDRQEWSEIGSPPGQRRAKKVKVSKETVRVQDALTKPKRNINLD